MKIFQYQPSYINVAITVKKKKKNDLGSQRLCGSRKTLNMVFNLSRMCSNRSQRAVIVNLMDMKPCIEHIMPF